MAWKSHIEKMIAESSTERAKYKPRDSTSADFFYWHGYSEILEKLLKEGSAGFLGLLQQWEDNAAFETQNAPEGSSSRQYALGAVDALHRARRVLREDAELPGGD